MFGIITGPVTAHKNTKKVTCTACGLKKCVGRCHWERVENPRPKKAA